MRDDYGKLLAVLTQLTSFDAPIALPILITALSQTAAKYMKGRKRRISRLDAN